MKNFQIFVACYSGLNDMESYFKKLAWFYPFMFVKLTCMLYFQLFFLQIPFISVDFERWKEDEGENNKHVKKRGTLIQNK